MTSDIQPLIAERPHLEEPLTFYAKWQRFHAQATELLAKKGGPEADNGRAYPPDKVMPLLQVFASAFALEPESLVPLGQALQDGQIDFMRLPLNGVPAFSLPYDEGELVSLLFLVSRPYFLALRESCVLDGREWEGGRCPLCSARSALASVAEGPRRHLHCSWCGTTGPSPRFLGCPNCGSEDAAQLATLVPEGENGFRVLTCDACRSYVKIVEGQVLRTLTPDLADLASLSLDIVAQDKGYARRVPNPIGLNQMS